MSQQPVAMIREMYGASAAGDVPSAVDAMDPQLDCREAEPFPYADGNPYRGPSAVESQVFTHLRTEWGNWALTLEQLLDAGDRVVALGSYKAKHNATSRAIDAQFAHVWRLRNGKAVEFQQHTDTAQVDAAMPGA
jgi:ketosteroid isomerase-like protein